MSTKGESRQQALKFWYNNQPKSPKSQIVELRKRVVEQTKVKNWQVIWNWMNGRTQIPPIQNHVLTQITGINFDSLK